MSDLLALIRGDDPAPSNYVHRRSSKLPRPPRMPAQESLVEEPRKRGFFRSITSKASSKTPAQPQVLLPTPPPNSPWRIPPFASSNASVTSLPSTRYTDSSSMRYGDGLQMERRGSMQLPRQASAEPRSDGSYSSSAPQLSRLPNAHIDRSVEGLRVPPSVPASNEHSRRYPILPDNGRRPSISSTNSQTTGTHVARQEAAPFSNLSQPHSWDSGILTIPVPAVTMPSASSSIGGHADDPFHRDDSPPPAYSQRSSLTVGIKAALSKPKQPILRSSSPLHNTLVAEPKSSEDSRRADVDSKSSKSNVTNETPTPVQIASRSPYPTAEQKAAAIAAVQSRRKTHAGSLQPPIALRPLSSFLEL